MLGGMQSREGPWHSMLGRGIASAKALRRERERERRREQAQHVQGRKGKTGAAGYETALRMSGVSWPAWG